MRAPVLGGNFAVWGGLFSVCDCSLTHLRGTEDAWNAILSGGITGGTLAARAGPKAIGRNFVVGAILLALIEGVQMAVSKAMMRTQLEMAGQVKVDRLDPPFPPGYGSRVLFGSDSSDGYASLRMQ